MRTSVSTAFQVRQAVWARLEMLWLRPALPLCGRVLSQWGWDCAESVGLGLVGLLGLPVRIPPGCVKAREHEGTNLSLFSR